MALAAPGADVYGAQPELSHVSLSPDGAHIAMFVPQGDTGGVRISKVGGASCAFGAGKVKFRNIFWANPDRLIVEVSFTYSGDKATNDPKYMFEIYRAISVDARCENSKDLLADIKNIGAITGGNFMGTTPDGQRVLFAALNINRRARDMDTRLKGISTSSYDVYAIDPSSGKSEKYEAGSNKTIGWYVDGAGVLRLRTDRKSETDESYVVRARIGDSKDWELVYDSASVTDESRTVSFVAVSASGDVAYVMTRNGGDKYGVYEFDLKAKTLGRKLFQSNRVDAEGLLVDNNSQRAVGTSYIDDYPIDEYFDKTYAQMQADLVATFPGEYVAIRSVSKDQRKFVAYVEGAQNPGGAYHFVDMTIPEMTKIGARYSSLRSADIAPVKSFSYPARDGMTIPAYLTLPPASSGKGLPLVVYPHGGPQSRDDAAFDPYAQFLATRGYAVLQPQFRGSSGFGARHLEAGYFKWGLEMQHDVTDGVKHLVANGTVDASKVCIFGFSYGGYSAMAGLAFTPDVYKCGISGAGPSDLLLLVGDIARSSEFDYLGTDGWREWIGDPTRDRSRLIATSPVKHVERIKVPLLLIHGADDIVVPLRQSTVMADAMKEAGKPVELIVIQGDDHWLSRASTNKRVLQELERFLGKHLK